MSRREKIVQWIGFLAAAALAAFGARYGIEIPIPAPPIFNAPPGNPSGPPAPPKEAGPDPANALCRLSFKGVGCSATVIGPRRQDGRWWVLTAAHCSSGVGQHGTIRFLDGRVTGVIVQSINRSADCAWMITEGNSEVYPYALLAVQSPAIGAEVWHAGYGVDRPGNRETGRVFQTALQNGQIAFKLSVSSGDSGGGIIANSAGEVVSCVCCTTDRGKAGTVFGASPESIAASKPTAMVLDDWEPIEVPLIDVPKEMPRKK